MVDESVLQRQSSRRGGAWFAAAAAAVLLHAALLQGVPWQFGVGPGSSEPEGPMTVRLLLPMGAPPDVEVQDVTSAPDADALAGQVVKPVATKPTEVASPVPGAPLSVRKRPAPPAPQAALTVPASVRALPDPVAPMAAPEPPEPSSALDAVELPAETIATVAVLPAPTPGRAGAAPPADRDVPVYRTVMPPATDLRYVLRRGGLKGTGDLRWRPQGNRYEARLEGRVAGVRVLSQVSTGGFDSAGIAPERFTDQRLTGGVRAANFQRSAGKITFSGPAVEYALLKGSQDRLSWMVQLAAVVSAEPQRLHDGGRVIFHVVGARGDAKLWSFRFVGFENLVTGAGPVRAARFAREASEPYDTAVDVWLDPQRHQLPVRALLRSGPGEEALELLLQDALPVS